MQIPVPLIGQAYKHRDLDLAAQTSKNFWPEFNRETQKIITMQPWPGRKAAGTGTGDDGGMYTFNDVLYKVTGTTLESETSAGVRTTIGTIAGAGLCSFADNGNAMVIVRGGNVYSYNGTTLTTGTDPDFESPNYVTVLKNQAIYPGTGRRFWVSQPDDLMNLDGLDFATKESRGDDLVRPFAFGENILLFGKKSIEQWWVSGSGNPPVDPIQGGTIEKGLLAAHSVSYNDRYLYFLGDDYVVYRYVGGQISEVSVVPLSQEFRTYVDATNAIGTCLSFDGQHFYYLHFPNEQTWCYCEESNGWFELTNGYQQNPYGATSYAETYGRHYFAVGGNTYYLDSDTYDNNGDVIVRERISDTISARLFNPSLEGTRMEMAWLELMVKTQGLETGQGSSPVIMFSYSDDAGRTWSSERHLTGQQSGQYIWRIRTYQLGSFVERLIRVRISDSVKCSILFATADVSMGIN